MHLHVTPPASPVRTSTISRTLKSEWTKLRTLPSTWRTAAMAVTLSIGLGAVLCISQANQWATMTAAQRATFDPTACSLGGFFLVGAVLLGALAVRDRDGRVLDGDDPVHLHRHARPTPGTGSQGCGHRGIRLPGGVARRRGQLRSRSAGLRRQAPPGIVRSSWRSPGPGLRRPWREPRRRHRGRSRRPHPPHGGGDRRRWCWSSWEGPCSASSSQPASVSTYPEPHSRPPSPSIGRAGLLQPGAAIAVLSLYAAIAVTAASVRMGHRDA